MTDLLKPVSRENRTALLAASNSRILVEGGFESSQTVLPSLHPWDYE